MNRRAFLQCAVLGAVALSAHPQALAGVMMPSPQVQPSATDSEIDDYLQKMRQFDRPHSNDRLLDPKYRAVLKYSVCRLRRIQNTVGYSRFHLLDFDSALKTASAHHQVGGFKKEELDFLEWLFYEDAASYGFLGKKPLLDLTDRIRLGEVEKIGETGHYLYKGKSLELYGKLKKAVGRDLELTSGIRSIIKQILLFLAKTERSQGNLSLASRSLAPPGFSYHGIGDFDVGQAGFGAANFTEHFAKTEVFRRLKALGYVSLRYPTGNLLGVRFEPWHIRVDLY